MHLYELPYDVISRIFDFCTYGVLHYISQTSKLMYKIYRKYDKYYEDADEDDGNLDEIISYIKIMKKSANRKLNKKNKKESHSKQFLYDGSRRELYNSIIHSLRVYVSNVYDIKCCKCNNITYSNEIELSDLYGFIRNHIIFCEKCMIYICWECSKEKDIKYPICDICGDRCKATEH